METDNLRNRAGSPVTKVATNCVANHISQFLDGLTLRCNGVPEGCGYKSTVRLVFPNLEDDFAHVEIIAHHMVFDKLHGRLQIAGVTDAARADCTRDESEPPLTSRCIPARSNIMFTVPEGVMAKAMALSAGQKLVLARTLIESAEGAGDPTAEAAWDAEIRERMRAIDESTETGVSYEEVMREADARLGL